VRVLLAHNFYQSSSPSGEDSVYREERALLEGNGVEVVPYERHSDTLSGAGWLELTRSALDVAWSRNSYREVRELVERTQPTVAHFHNTFPLISPSAYAACRDAGVPVVQTLHNFRLVCPGAMLFRENRPCEECLSGSLLPALRHRCYRQSLPATAAVVRALHVNRRRGTYTSLVNRYIALTQFARDRFVTGGLPGALIEIKPNGLSHPPEIGDGRGGYAVFVGRLGEEKGIRVLLEAWRSLPDKPLRIVGDGPLRAELEEISGRHKLNVTFTGRLQRDEVAKIMGSAAVVILPSLCFEGLPMVAIEAFACGTPVIASQLGSLGEIVDDRFGRRFEAGNATALAATVREVMSNEQSLLTMRTAARVEFERRYSPAANFSALMRIYEAVSTHPEQSAA